MKTINSFTSLYVTAVIFDSLTCPCNRSLLPQIDHVVKGHAAYAQLQEQAQQRSADTFRAQLSKITFLSQLSSLFS